MKTKQLSLLEFLEYLLSTNPPEFKAPSDYDFEADMDQLTEKAKKELKDD